MQVSLDIFGGSNSLRRAQALEECRSLCQTTGNLIAMCIPKLEDCQLKYFPGIYY